MEKQRSRFNKLKYLAVSFLIITLIIVSRIEFDNSYAVDMSRVISFTANEMLTETFHSSKRKVDGEYEYISDRSDQDSMLMVHNYPTTGVIRIFDQYTAPSNSENTNLIEEDYNNLSVSIADRKNSLHVSEPTLSSFNKYEVYNIDILGNDDSPLNIDEGIQWAVDNGIDIIDLSYVTDELIEKIQPSIQNAQSNGMIFLRNRSVDVLSDSKNFNFILSSFENANTSMNYIPNPYIDDETKETDNLSTVVDQGSLSTPIFIAHNKFELLELIQYLLYIDPSLDTEQIRNLLVVSANPTGDINSNLLLLNPTRTVELIQYQINSGLSSDKNVDAGMKFEESNVFMSSIAPQITAENITTNSITWQVNYMNPNAWGNRLELYDYTSNKWYDVSGTYYTQNGTYTSENLIPGNTYKGRLTYYSQGWIVVDTVVTTIALGNASLQMTEITDVSVNMNVNYPSNAVYGNRLEIYNRDTGEWRFITTNYLTESGVYHVDGLTPSTRYTGRMLWYSNGWKTFDVYFETLIPAEKINYEYDVNGRLIKIRNQYTDTELFFSYDENGNLISVRKEES